MNDPTRSPIRKCKNFLMIYKVDKGFPKQINKKIGHMKKWLNVKRKKGSTKLINSPTKLLKTMKRWKTPGKGFHHRGKSFGGIHLSGKFQRQWELKSIDGPQGNVSTCMYFVEFLFSLRPTSDNQIAVWKEACSTVMVKTLTRKEHLWFPLSAWGHYWLSANREVSLPFLFISIGSFRRVCDGSWCPRRCCYLYKVSSAQSGEAKTPSYRIWYSSANLSRSLKSGGYCVVEVFW